MTTARKPIRTSLRGIWADTRWIVSDRLLIWAFSAAPDGTAKYVLGRAVTAWWSTRDRLDAGEFDRP